MICLNLEGFARSHPRRPAVAVYKDVARQECWSARGDCQMPRRDPIVAAITLFLLNVFTVSAAGAVVKLTPQRELEPRAAAVADRSLVQPGNLADDVAAAAP